ncbi:MAG: cytochrome c [Flavobacteriales bacterium]|nr:cytochrome c [Flavobacteriales bacterium]
MHHRFFVILLVVGTFGYLGFKSYTPLEVDQNTPLSLLVNELEGKTPLHTKRKTSDKEIIQRGYDLVHEGRAKGPDGKMSSKQSKHFTCRSCHNVVQEDPSLGNPNPEARLKYAVEKNLPFLQGTTLWGIVNREHWYNGDYFKKYGSLVDPARDTLENAVQLCAVQCSQGRAYEEWEMEAVMAYLWSLELKISDLGLKESDLSELNKAVSGDAGAKTAALKMLKSKYMTASPATFKYPWKGMPVKNGEGGNTENGKNIYKKSCMHCHKQGGFTNFTLDISKLDLKLLANNVEKDNDFSVYWITRLGTHPIPGYKPYMPHYPLERLSDQQIEDLVAYIKANN